MPLYLETLLLVVSAFLIGVGIAWLIWGGKPGAGR